MKHAGILSLAALLAATLLTGCGGKSAGGAGEVSGTAPQVGQAATQTQVQTAPQAAAQQQQANQMAEAMKQQAMKQGGR